MKNSNTNKIGSAQRFTHWAAVLTLAASLVIMGLFTACPNAAGGGGTSSGGTGGGTPQSKYTVNFNVEDGNGFLIAKVGDTIIDSGAQVEKDTTVIFTALPAEGYEVGIWTIEGGTFESGSGTPGDSYARVKVTAPVTVKVRFIKETDLIPSTKLDIEGTVLKGFKEGENPAGILRVPAYITEIAYSAFSYCTGITEVHLPENLTKIGEYAFVNCTGMRKLTLSKNLSLIDEGAFKDCDKLTALDFSKCTQPLTIGKLAFTSCYKISGSIKFPAKLTSLGEDAFEYCLEVENFDFRLCSNPPLTAIGTNAFNSTNGRFKVKTDTGIKELLTGSGVAADRIDEEP